MAETKEIRVKKRLTKLTDCVKTTSDLRLFFHYLQILSYLFNCFRICIDILSDNENIIE